MIPTKTMIHSKKIKDFITNKNQNPIALQIGGSDLKDLQNWETIEREPLCKLINPYKICGFPPPTSGGIGLIQIISLLNNKKDLINNKDPHLPKHLFIEASRLAYQDRNLYVTDPLFFDVPTKELISEKYFGSLGATIATLILTLIILLFAETIPKTLLMRIFPIS